MTVAIQVSTVIDKDVLVNGRPLLTGIRGHTRFTHCFSLYRRSRIVDFEEVIEYEETACVASLRYWFPVMPGGDFDLNDVLIVPEWGKPKTIALNRMHIPRNNPRFRLYSNPLVPHVTMNTEPGFFAWYDRKAANGLAVYYNDDYCRKRWLPFFINVNGRSLYSTSGRPTASPSELIYSFKDCPLKTPGRFHVRFRYIGLNAESPERISSGYALWKQADRMIRISSAESIGSAK